MVRSRIAYRVRQIRRLIWFRAALISALGIVVALLAGPAARAVPYEFTGDIGQSAVDAILTILASSMLAVTTFSLTAMVSAYSSATQIGTPRATQLLISDRTSQNALSTFLGAFVFAIFGVIGLQTEIYGGQGRVLLLLATVALIGLVVVTLLRWIAHLAAFGRMADIIDRVEDAASSAMAGFADDPYSGGRPAVAIPAGAMPVAPDRIGYVTHIDVPALARLATRHGLTIHVEALPGVLVHHDRPLMRVVGAFDDDVRSDLRGAVTLDRHRSFDHDPRLGVIALAEIASRALSPATNDPGTAVEVLNALLRVYAHLPVDTPPPARELPPVYLPRPEIADLLRDGFAPIIRDNDAEEVAVRLFKTLATLRTMLPHAGAVLRDLADELRRAVERTQADDAVRARILASAGPAPRTNPPA